MTPERARELFDYDPETGVLSWRDWHGRWNREPPGPAGTLNRYGYLVVRVDGKQYKVHRLCWAVHYGVWPENGLDHENRRRADNRLCNLLDRPQRLNAKNRAAPRVSWDRARGRWRARVKADYRTHYGGRHVCFGRAVRAAQELRQHLHREVL